MGDACAVELRDVAFHWPGTDVALLNIDHLPVGRGEKLFVKGPSGSCKTTLLSLIAGVVTPQRGSVSILDLEISAMSGRRRDSMRVDHIGFIFQMFNLIPYLSVRENVTLPCRFSTNRRQRAIESGETVAGEAERLLARLGLGDLTTKPAARLSVGQQQRVAVARALIGHPEIVIADEPTSSLDAEARGEFLDLLFTQCDATESTLLFVSHDATLEPRFDRHVSLLELNAAASG
jgi:putative ABC transport system ATP-binding protein